MKAKDKIVFWITALVLSWIIGRVFLWTLLRVVIPVHQSIWGNDLTWVIPLDLIGTYENLRLAIAGTVIVMIGSLILSYYVDKTSITNPEQMKGKKFRLISIVATSLRITLAGYLVVFQVYLENYWFRIAFPNVRIIYTRLHLEIYISLFMTIWLVGCLLIVLPRRAIFSVLKICFDQRKRPKYLLWSEVAIYAVLSVLLVWSAVPPYPQTGFSGDIAIGFLGVLCICLGAWDKRNKMRALLIS